MTIKQAQELLTLNSVMIRKAVAAKDHSIFEQLLSTQTILERRIEQLQLRRFDAMRRFDSWRETAKESATPLPVEWR